MRETIIKIIEKMGIRIVEMRDRLVKVLLPLEPNINHIGTIYAGSIFSVGEYIGGPIFVASFDYTKFYPIVRVSDSPGELRPLKAGLNTVQLFKVIPRSRFIARQMHMPYIKLFCGVLFSGWKAARQLAYMANAFDSFSRATRDGDLEHSWLTVGQVKRLVKDIPTVKELMERMVAQAETVSAKVSQ